MSMLLWILVPSIVDAFVPAPGLHPSPGSSIKPLFGISEWRDTEIWESREMKNIRENGPGRHITVLPICSDQILLPGQEKCIQFVKDSEVRLFQKAIDCHAGIFGLGLVTPSGDVLDSIPIVEVQDSLILDHTYGIFASCRVVGRVRLTEITMEEPFVEALSFERFDDDLLAGSLDLANEAAGMIESLVADISDIEATVCVANEESRMERFKSAYHDAMEYHSHGFLTGHHDDTSARSLQQLTAISWAAFSTGAYISSDESNLRLHAMDMNNVVNRLKMAMYWLTDVRMEVETTVL